MRSVCVVSQEQALAESAPAKPASAPKPSASSTPVAVPRVDWKAVWPLPVLALATVALVGGVVKGLLNVPAVDPAAPLVEVRALVAAGEYEKAIETVNQKLLPAITVGAIAPEASAEALLLRARSLLSGQAALGVRLPANYKSALTDFEQSVAFGGKLSDVDRADSAEAHAALGDTKKAVELARELPESLKDRRLVILRRVVDANLAAKDVRYDQTVALLGELLEADGASMDERAWAIARQAELRLAMSFDEEAITKLLVAIPRLEGISAERRGELVYLLGKAYYQAGQFEQAAKQLASARTFLEPQDALMGEAGVLIGRILQAGGQLEQAREEFQAVYERHGGGGNGPVGAGLPAALGLGETQAAAGEDGLALESYGEVIGHLLEASGAAAQPQSGRAESGHGAGAESKGDHGSASDHGAAGAKAGAGEAAAKKDEHGSAAKPEHGEKAGGEKAGGEEAVGERAAGHGSGRQLAGGAGVAGGSRRDVTVALVGASLMDRYAERASSGEHTRALPYAMAAERLYRGTKTATPASVPLGIGASSRAEGMRILNEARTTPTGQLPIDQISPVTQAEAKKYLIEAGVAFRDHAAKVVVTDKGAFDESTWNSADCFDLAADRENAKMAFSAYIQSAASDDPRRPEARFRLAQTLQAERDYAAAAAGYRQLIDAASAGQSGPFADAAIVPLARCYLLDDKAENDAQAEQLLLGAVDGATVPPESEVYRSATVELGEMLHARGRYPEAIERLDEAVTRYPDHERFAVLVFKLADANRLSAAELGEELKQAKPQRDLEVLTVLREQRLQHAGQLFAKTIDLLAKKDRRKFTRMDKLAERNSTFALGDVAFEQGDFDRAITLYDAARQKYTGDPSSLVAMVQIVNCYVAQNKWSEAATANERARQQLASLPEDVWKSPDLPMERKHWERWLDASSLLDRRFGASRAVGGE